MDPATRAKIQPRPADLYAVIVLTAVAGLSVRREDTYADPSELKGGYRVADASAQLGWPLSPETTAVRWEPLAGRPIACPPRGPSHSQLRLSAPAGNVTAARTRTSQDLVHNLPLGGTDASVIALAERFNAENIATLDRRHFTIVRPAHTTALTLLP